MLLTLKKLRKISRKEIIFFLKNHSLHRKIIDYRLLGKESPLPYVQLSFGVSTKIFVLLSIIRKIYKIYKKEKKKIYIPPV